MNLGRRSIALHVGLIVAGFVVAVASTGALWYVLFGFKDEFLTGTRQMVAAQNYESWREGERTLRNTLFAALMIPAVALALLGIALVALRHWGLGLHEDEKEARLRVEANQDSIVSGFDSGERIARVFLARPRTFAALPQLIVAILPIPIAAATLHATVSIAINMVLGGWQPPFQWTSLPMLSYVVRPADVDIQFPGIMLGYWTLPIEVAGLVAGFVLVRALWPGGRINLAVSAAWFGAPLTFIVVDHVLRPVTMGWGIYAGPVTDWRLWLMPLWWPGSISLSYFFIALLVFDLWAYFRMHQHYLFVLTEHKVYLFRGRYADYRWQLLTKIAEPPRLLRRVDRPLGCDLTLQCGPQTVHCTLHSRAAGDDFMTALGVERVPTVCRRRGFMIELITRCGWLIAIYAWLALAYVNVAHASVRQGILGYRVIAKAHGYETGQDIEGMRKEVVFVLGVQPENDVAGYYRARLLEDDGKNAEAKAIYQRLNKLPGQKIRNASNERLMKMHVRQKASGER